MMTNPLDDLLEQREPQPNGWGDYTIERIREVLVMEEIHLEDRNGYFYWMIAGGAFFIGLAIYHGTRPDADVWAFVQFVAGAILLVSGIALRINGALELKRIRRALSLLQVGKFP